MLHSWRSPRVLLAAGLAFGAVAEWVGRPPLLVLDSSVGALLVVAGYVAWASFGPLVFATGVAWFGGTLWSPLVYLHRALLAQLILLYPRALPRTSRERITVGAIWAYALGMSFWSNDELTIAFAVALFVAAAARFVRVGGRERRVRATAALGALAYGTVLAFEAAVRLAGSGNVRAQLVVYDLAVALVGAAVAAGSVWGGSTRAAVTSLALELGGKTGPLPLRDRLARALGDPALVLAYSVDGGYVDESGRPIELSKDGGRAVTPVLAADTPVAALIHDPVLLDEPELVSAVAALTGLAVSNARLQAETRTRAREVAASRRRLIEAADLQRRRLERELRGGAVRRLDEVVKIVVAVDAELGSEVAAARAELEAFAQGVHPALLTDRGLATALVGLARRAALPVTVEAPEHRFEPAVEAAVYFVCSEALTNAAKHAEARHVAITLRAAQGLLHVEVADDGVGGADPALGSGLRGLIDRVDALGGRLSIDSRSSSGTRLAATLPLSRSTA